METSSESNRAAGTSLSVVVVSRNTPETLERCLVSLSHQDATEILVMDASPSEPAETLRERFPAVQFRHFGPRFSIPELRREGFREATSSIVAFTEGWMIPSESWVAELRAAHRDHPHTGVIGGTISFPCPHGAFGAAEATLAWADYFSEYSQWIPRAAQPSVTAAENLCGANCSYTREAIEQCRGIVDQAVWEPLLHAALRQAGYRLLLASNAAVCYRREISWSALLASRFHHGRGHGATRFRNASLLRRLTRAAGAPLVPFVLTVRTWHAVPSGGGLHGRLLAASGWLLVLYSAWALGEATGALGLLASGSREPLA